MCETNGKIGACYSRHCEYCRPACAAIHQSHRIRPHPDLNRGTGRTTTAVKQAVLAAAFGNRVAYVCGTQQHANDACRIAADFIARSDLPTCRLSVRKDCITFYGPNGTVVGIIKFIGMGQEECINRGVPRAFEYGIIRDHYCEELLAEKARKEARAAALGTIKALMHEHGIDRVYTTGGDFVFA